MLLPDIQREYECLFLGIGRRDLEGWQLVASAGRRQLQECDVVGTVLRLYIEHFRDLSAKPVTALSRRCPVSHAAPIGPPVLPWRKTKARPCCRAKASATWRLVTTIPASINQPVPANGAPPGKSMRSMRPTLSSMRFGDVAVRLRQRHEPPGFGADHRGVLEIQPVLFDEEHGPFFGDDRLKGGKRAPFQQRRQIVCAWCHRLEPCRPASTCQILRILLL